MKILLAFALTVLIALPAFSSVRSQVNAQIPTGYVQLAPTTVYYYFYDNTLQKWVQTTNKLKATHRQQVYRTAQPTVFKIVIVYTKDFAAIDGDSFDIYDYPNADFGTIDQYTEDDFKLDKNGNLSVNGQWSAGPDVQNLWVFARQP